MRSINSLLRGLIGIAGFLLISNAAIYACVVKSQPDPCGLEEDIVWAMKGGIGTPPHRNWESRLDWTFERWRNGSSENWGPLAHAVALWRPPVPGKTLADNVQWWNTFFDCQTGLPCVVPGIADVGTLKYLKGAELLSHNYDAAVTAGVASVHYWAKKTNNQALADKARKYLRVTFAMYSLAAGQGPAAVLIDDDPNPKPSDNCQRNLSGSAYYYTGPFIAAASMRANPGYVCTDDRGVLLSRALHITFKNNREDSSQALLVDYLQTEWAKMVNTALYENVYALDPNSRALILDHINTGNQCAALKFVLSGVRTSVVYHLMGWETLDGQERVTMMENNRNGNTAPVMAEKYTYGPAGNIREAHVLIPDTDFRNNVPLATARFLYSGSTPHMIEATSYYSSVEGQPPAINRIVYMGIPTYGKKYHLVLSPTQEIAVR